MHKFATKELTWAGISHSLCKINTGLKKYTNISRDGRDKYQLCQQVLYAEKKILT